MRIGLRYVLLFTFALPASPGTITRATCSVLYSDGATLTATSPSYCAFFDLFPGPPELYPDVEAGGNGVYANGPEPVSAHQSTNGMGGGTWAWTMFGPLSDEPGGDVVEWVASATSKGSLRAVTLGPSRPGLIELDWLAGGVSINTSSTAFWNLGGYFGSAYIENQSEAECVEPPGTTVFFRGVFGFTYCGTVAGESPGTITLPFLLGTPFDMGFQVSSVASGFNFEPKLTLMRLDVSFRLTELDGTPVDVHLVPEPGSWTLTGIGLLAFAASRRLRATLAGRLGRR